MASGRKTRCWLLVRADPIVDFARTDWYDELAPLPEELGARDRIAIIAWPARGLARQPIVAATASVIRIDAAERRLRLRRRVTAIAHHEVSVASLGVHVVATRGWTIARRRELLGVLRLISERDFDFLDSALLDVAHHYGPAPRRQHHSRPRTPGRRALIAGRASVAGSRR